MFDPGSEEDVRYSNWRKLTSLLFVILVLYYFFVVVVYFLSDLHVTPLTLQKTLVCELVKFIHAQKLGFFFLLKNSTKFKMYMHLVICKSISAILIKLKKKWCVCDWLWLFISDSNVYNWHIFIQS